ncbi:MAG TPA: hypothetical protein ENL45_02140 [Candidatus Woesearchaeota archaeon]|nr:hypothetical protein [Candidatus Woesearchaeota archaeon]
MAISKELIKKQASKKKWIQSAIGKKGALHRQLGIPEDKKIPVSKLLSIKSKLSKKAKGDKKLTASELKLLRRVNLALKLRSY